MDLRPTGAAGESVVEVVDFVSVYFETLRNQKVPATVDGKFVVITMAGERFAVFAPTQMCAFHAQIVARFMELRGHKGSLSVKGDRFTTNGVEISVGGGHFELDGAGVLSLYGSSTVYGGVELSDLASELETQSGLGAKKVVVR